MHYILFFLFALFVATTEACNCVGCSRTSLIVGGQSWCRCCQQTFLPDCTSDPLCSTSVFDSTGCISSGYGDTLCVYDESATTTTRTFPPVPVYTSPPTPATVDREGPTPPPERACNCVGCSLNGYSQGSRDWCRCCGVLFDDDCVWNSRCGETIFTKDGCEKHNWTDVCESNGYNYNNIISDGDAPNPPDTTTDNSNSSNSSLVIGIIITIAVVIGSLVLIAGCLVAYKVYTEEDNKTRTRSRTRSRSRSRQRSRQHV